MEKHVLIKAFLTVFLITLVSIAVVTPMVTAVSNGKIAFVSQRDGNDEIYTMNTDGSNVQRLTFDPIGSPKNDLSPAWSPDGTRIAFVSNRDGNYEIYVMNADGSNQQRITSSIAGDLNPTWSPDGTRIAFSTNRDWASSVGYEIYVMNTDGSNQQRLTYNDVDDANPAWSPEGTKIAFTTNRDGNYEIYVMNADGSNPQRRTYNTASDGSPAWSHDGTGIAFVRNFQSSVAEIYAINADACQECTGTAPTDLSETISAADVDPAFSPDGTRIAFATNRDGNYEIYTMNPDGTGKTRVTTNTVSDRELSWQPISGAILPAISINDVTLTEPNSGIRNFVFTLTRSGDTTDISSVNFATANDTATAPSDYSSNSGTLNFAAGETTKTVTVVVNSDSMAEPDEMFSVNLSNCIGCIITDTHGAGTILGGQVVSNGKIAFVSQRDGNDEIYTMNVDGSNVQRLTFDPVGSPKNDLNPAWSPDGTRIAFVSNRDGNHEIYVMNADGSNQQRLTSSGAGDLNPTWSPDGTRIAFATNRDWASSVGYEIYVMNTEGSNQQRLTYNSVDDVKPAWSPDGTKIAFTTNRDGNYEIYVMNTDGSNPQRRTYNTASDGNPAWSHDGTRIAFVRNFQSSVAEIYAINADACQECTGTAPMDLSETISAADVDPAFSPDGTKIAFATNKDGNYEIYVMNPDGSEQTRVTSNTASDSELSWQPISVTILPAITINDVTLTEPNSGIRNFIFTVTRSGDTTGISSVNFATVYGTATAPSDYASNSGTINFVAGETSKSVTVAVNSDTAAEPDETFFVNLSNCIGCIIDDSHGMGTILFGRAVSNGNIAFVSDRDGNDEIYTMNSDGSGQTRLTANIVSDMSPAWSPDGTRIAFVSNRDGNYEIYVMNADGSDQIRVTSSSVSDINPTWSPDGTRIAFATNRDWASSVGYEIYVMNADGSNQQRLTYNSVDDVKPTWSPDGTKIAFTTNRDGIYEIYIMNADGSNPQRRTYNTASDGIPAWSHDGTRIVFVRNFQSSVAEIYAINADACQECTGTAPMDLSETISAADVDPAFSPDGTRIAFATNKDGNYEIYVMNPDGSEQTRVTSNTASDSELSWQPISVTILPAITINDVTLTEPNSGIRNFVFTLTRSGDTTDISSVNFVAVNGTATAPSDYSSNSGTINFVAGETTKSVNVAVNSDTAAEPDETFFVNLSNCIGCIIDDSHGMGTILFGRAVSNGKIAFVSDRDGNDEIYTMNSDGSGQTRLTANIVVDMSPAWSPDGTRIAFVSNRNGGNYEIYVMNADGSNQQRLTSSTYSDLNPTWSPDGTRIAFATNRDTGSSVGYEIYLMNTDGSNQQKLTSNSVDDAKPTWSPDGTKIAFTTNRDGNYEIYIMNADGGNPKRRTNNIASDGIPAWSHDGTRIAFVRNFQSGVAEIYAINADACQECTGTAPMDLSETTSAADVDPAFSPDGTKIAFATNKDGNYEIYVMNPDGSEQTRVTSNTASDSELSWQPISVMQLSSISINDVTMPEGNSGTRTFVFTVTRSSDTSGTSSVNFSTSDVTATAGIDYVSNSGMLTFAPGQTLMTITVVVNGDTAVEPDETFNINLSNCAGCIVTGNQGVGIIQNDDLPPTPATYTISIKSGWNLISAPLNLTTWELGNETEVGDSLNVTPRNCILSIYRYNTTSKSFEKSDHFDNWGWYPATGSASFTKLEAGRGYWVMAKSDCILTFTGTAPSDLDIPLNTGWNLIGWYSTNEAALGEEAVVGNLLNVTPANSLTSIYRYNTTSALFEKSDHFPDWGWYPATGSGSFTTLEPGRGYWVMAQNDAWWRHKVN